MNKNIRFLSYPFVFIMYIIVFLFSYILALRRGLLFGIFELTRVNPEFKYSGFAVDNKFDILNKFKEFKELVLKSTLINKYSKYTNVKKKIKYPIIAKPNRGFSSFGVIKIDNDYELEQLMKTIKYEYILQEYCDMVEYSIFFIKNSKTNILSLTKKSGSDFIDISYKINSKLKEKIETILKNKKIYFGRFDVFSKNDIDLLEGKFKIIELNGSMSQPIHIYDKKYSFYNIFLETIKYYDLAFSIARKNKKYPILLMPIIIENIKLILVERPYIVKNIKKLNKLFKK